MIQQAKTNRPVASGLSRSTSGRDAATVAVPMIERRADWKCAEQSAARFFPTRNPSAARLSAFDPPAINPRPIRAAAWAMARAGAAIPPDHIRVGEGRF
jgi:hypothetical protein